jgi:hypothetical protein
MRKIFCVAPVFIFGLLFGCSEKQMPLPAASPVQNSPSDQFLLRPASAAAEKISEGGMCPIDWINRQHVVDSITSSKKNPFGLEGWFVVDSATQPTPKPVAALLSNDSGVYYLEGQRKERPDLATDKPMLKDAGVTVAGYLAQVPAGEYRLSLTTGQSPATVCNTKIKVVVTE